MGYPVGNVYLAFGYLYIFHWSFLSNKKETRPIYSQENTSNTVTSHPRAFPCIIRFWENINSYVHSNFKKEPQPRDWVGKKFLRVGFNPSNRDAFVWAKVSGFRENATKCTMAETCKSAECLLEGKSEQCHWRACICISHWWHLELC